MRDWPVSVVRVDVAAIARGHIGQHSDERKKISDHRPSANVSGTVVRNRGPPICDFFQKAESNLTLE
jgi:hypothetical protein